MIIYPVVDYPAVVGYIASTFVGQSIEKSEGRGSCKVYICIEIEFKSLRTPRSS